MADLDSILNGSDEGTETETVTETEETEQPEQETAQEETETGVEASQVAAETEQAPEPDEVKGLKAAAVAERQKRQKLEQEYQERIARLEQQLAQRQQPEEEPPYIDPDVAQQLTQTKTEFQQALVQQKLDISEAIARDRYTDFEDKLEVFKEMVKADPNVYNRMVAQGDPAGWMYKQVSEYQQMQKLKEIGDPAKYEAALREQLREQIKAELLAELEAAKKEATEAAIRSKLPKSGFAEERSTGTARPTQTFNGPPPLRDILKG